MAFKTWTVWAEYVEKNPTRVPSSKPRQEGSVIARIGVGRKATTDGVDEWIEQIYGIDNDILGYNTGKIMLMRCPQNDVDVEMYIGMPFTKGVTERETGRTILIVGSTAHHIEALVNQCDGAVWTPEDDIKKYGNTIRWINAGDTKNGFIGLDYNPKATQDAGVATSLNDVKYLANVLIEFGYDGQKRLFLLKPPYIQESDEGKRQRRVGKNTLNDWRKSK